MLARDGYLYRLPGRGAPVLHTLFVIVIFIVVVLLILALISHLRRP